MHLSSNTLYLICVLGIGNWLTYQNDFNNSNNNNSSNNLLGDLNSVNNGDMYPDSLKSLLSESTTSRCTEVRTLFALPNIIEMDGLSGGGIIHSILTRRLGLIVGCCLGIIVFIVLISVLGWLKLKKQRIEGAKRQQTLPPDFLSYRSYSISHEEGNRDNPQNNNAVAVLGNSVPSNNHSNAGNCQHHHMHNSHGHGHPNFISGTVTGTTTITS